MTNTRRKLDTQDGFFLSEANPTATLDVQDLERQALEMMSWPVIEAAKANATHRYKILAGKDVPEEAWRSFAEQMHEWTFHYLLLALNSDPNYPRVLGCMYGPPHEWFGRKVPGTRGPGTAENVDNYYAMIPVDGAARFELHGQLMDDAVGDFPIHITANLSQSANVSALDPRDMVFEDDGSFVITIDPEPANGRANHLQSSVDSKYIFIRDGRVDWSQQPNSYRITRLDPPTARARTAEEIADMASRFIIDDVPQNFWFKQMIGFLEPNSLSEVHVSVDVGGMPSQKLLRGRVVIDDDEAFVLHLGPGESKYWVLILYDWWGMSGDFWSRPSSLNNTQSVANADGSYTYVFSIKDPGVHNWIDTLGLHETLFMNRWRLLPQTSGGPGGDPWAKGELMKLTDLKHRLPAGTRWVSEDERRRQLAERYSDFQSRFSV